MSLLGVMQNTESGLFHSVVADGIALDCLLEAEN